MAAAATTAIAESTHIESPPTDLNKETAPVLRPKRPVRRQTALAAGEDTRLRIIAAALDTLGAEGITGASARAIARRGDFNQALIFYHFGSVEGLLLAAALSDSDRRAAAYETSFAKVNSLAELIAVAREVHAHEQAQGSTKVLAQLLAGASASTELADGVLAAMQPWLRLVESAVTRVLEGTALAPLVPADQIAFAIASMFLGMELLAGLDRTGDRAEAFFTGTEALAVPISAMLGATRAAPPAERPARAGIIAPS
jgi:AcrR family transcriptional regulator